MIVTIIIIIITVIIVVLKVQCHMLPATISGGSKSMGVNASGFIAVLRVLVVTTEDFIMLKANMLPRQRSARTKKRVDILID